MQMALSAKTSIISIKGASLILWSGHNRHKQQTSSSLPKFRGFLRAPYDNLTWLHWLVRWTCIVIFFESPKRICCKLELLLEKVEFHPCWATKTSVPFPSNIFTYSLRRYIGKFIKAYTWYKITSNSVYCYFELHLVEINQINLRWFPSKRIHHRFPMKLGVLLLQDKETLKM